MANVMTLRSVRTVALAAALGAACGGGDPPGGGNGDTDGGGTTDGMTGNGGRTDGYVPNPNNPLIAVIPGTWEYYAADIPEDEAGWLELPPEERALLTATIDAMHPDCAGSLGQVSPVGPPGDACIHWISNDLRGPELQSPYWILDGDRVRANYIEGRVLDGGRRIEYFCRCERELGTRLRKID